MSNILAEDNSDNIFSKKECRIVASLMEKELTVPDSYPLTLNSLVLSCNQKNNREPVMALVKGDVGHMCSVLKDRNIIKIEYGDRAYRYAHKIRQFLSIDKQQQSLLTIMMMRGPQTLNMLKTRTSRITSFEDINAIKVTLDGLINRELPLVKHLPQSAGQREERYGHLLCGDIEVQADNKPLPTFKRSDESVRIAELEQQVSNLLTRIERIEKKLL